MKPLSLTSYREGGSSCRNGGSTSSGIYKEAELKKEEAIQSLQHSLAIHSLEKGTEMRFIIDLLGHFNIKPTEKYLHMSKNRWQILVAQ